MDDAYEPDLQEFGPVGSWRLPHWVHRVPRGIWPFVALAVIDVGLRSVPPFALELPAVLVPSIAGIATVLLPAAILWHDSVAGRATPLVLRGAVLLAILEIAGLVVRIAQRPVFANLYAADGDVAAYVAVRAAIFALLGAAAAVAVLLIAIGLWAPRCAARDLLRSPAIAIVAPLGGLAALGQVQWLAFQNADLTLLVSGIGGAIVRIGGIAAWVLVAAAIAGTEPANNRGRLARRLGLAAIGLQFVPPILWGAALSGATGEAWSWIAGTADIITPVGPVLLLAAFGLGLATLRRDAADATRDTPA